MEVTDAGISMEVILVSWNAVDAMLTSSLPVLNVTDVRLEQS